MEIAAPFLFVVSREDPSRYDFVKEHFAGEGDVEVVVDRRRGERRTVLLAPAASDRRGTDRRHTDLSTDLRALGWGYVRRSEPASDRDTPNA